MIRRPHHSGRWVLAPIAAVALLGGLTADRVLYHLPAGDPAPYHQAIVEAGRAVPYRIGDWTGFDEEVPKSAVALLKPNLLLGRRYENGVTGKAVSMFLVHCKDARDIGGHYPPRCYPSSGWVTERTIPREWVIEGRKFPGRQYLFHRQSQGLDYRITVYNFIMRPGVVEPDMSGIREAAADRRRKHFGGSQFQLVLSGDVDPAAADAILAELLPGFLPVIDAILAEDVGTGEGQES